MKDEELLPLEYPGILSSTTEELPAQSNTTQVLHREGQCTLVIPSLPKTIHDHELILKEAFPRLHSQIMAMWGSQEAHDRLAHLLWNDSVDRDGFPSNVVFALMALYVEHTEQFRFQPTPINKATPIKQDKW